METVPCPPLRLLMEKGNRKINPRVRMPKTRSRSPHEKIPAKFKYKIRLFPKMEIMRKTPIKMVHRKSPMKNIPNKDIRGQ